MDLTTSPDPGNLAEATELHRYAEALIVSLAADGTAPDLPPGVTDVPGYWLGPAVGALVLIRSGKDALEPLALANELDERRTALFLCLALAVCGHGDRIHASWLGTAFGDLSEDRPVTSGQRALWLAAARGAYGPVGKIFVLRKLDAVNVPATDDRWLKALVPALPETSVPASLEAFPELAKVAEIERSLRASVTLRRLRDRCTEITSTRQAGEVTKVVRGTVWAEDEPLAVLRALAGQGGQEGPLSSLTGHLLQDLAPDADPHMAALALHVAAPAVRGAAESLVEVVREPPPDTMDVPILGYPITLRPEGPDQESMAAAEQQLVTECVPKRTRPWPGYVLLVLAVVVVAGGFVISPPLALVGLLVAAVGGHLLWRHRVREHADVRFVQTRAGKLGDLADKAVWALHEYARESEERASDADRDLAELSTLLRRGPRAA
ncbi:hypothetical protein [Microbispora bryophytorum]|nr:hypothetical protein [Microbispora bryophytorum]MBD3141109.1 hypothetical protein [Microbispora bryophytorum]TQS02224.1 hypothetical protein FLX07_29870 [Microbispora bryophytorum]